MQIPILLPLVVGTGAILCTILFHAMPVGGIIWFVRRERKIGHTGRGFWTDTGIVVPVVLLAMMAHLWLANCYFAHFSSGSQTQCNIVTLRSKLATRSIRQGQGRRMKILSQRWFVQKGGKE